MQKLVYSVKDKPMYLCPTAKWTLGTTHTLPKTIHLQETNW